MQGTDDRPWRRWTPIVGAFLLAFAARLVFWDAPLYGDEAAHFYFARSLGQPADGLSYVYPEFPSDYAPLETFFWQRPVFHLALAPAAAISFDAYRILFAGLGSLIAPLVFVLLRDRDVRPLIAGTATAFAAVVPTLAVWGTHVYPDTLMTASLVAALLAERRRRPLLAGLFLLLAIWTKETALVAGLALLATTRRAGDMPLRIGKWSHANGLRISYGVALVLGPLPLLLSLALGGRVPGWAPGGDVGSLVDRVVLTPWLLPLVAAGLLWPRSRRLSFLALAYPLFYLVYEIAMGRAAQAWYFVPSIVFAIPAGALVADEAIRRAQAGNQTRRRATYTAGVVVTLLLLLQVAVPASVPARNVSVAPFSQHPDPNWTDALAIESARNTSLVEMHAALTFEERERPFLVDVDWYFLLHPFLSGGSQVRYAYTWLAEDLGPWVDAVENRSTAAILSKTGGNAALNAALREVYAPCQVHENEGFIVVAGPACDGRGRDLRRAYEAHLAAAPDS